MSMYPSAFGDMLVPAVRNNRFLPGGLGLPPDEEDEDDLLEQEKSDDQVDAEYFGDIGDVFAEIDDSEEEQEKSDDQADAEYLGDIDDVFDEIDDSEEEAEQDEDSDTLKLSISQEHADENYANAGKHMEELEDTVKIEEFKEHLSERADAALREVDNNLNLPYETAPFQRIAIHCIVENKSVVLVKECGSGKMDVALKGALVKRLTEGEPRGLTLVVQPLSSLMQEKMDNRIAPSAVLSMGQELTVMGEGGDGEKAVLSCSLEELFSGRVAILFGHPESFSTPLGQFILSRAQKENLILLVVLDEWHASDEWHNFRPVQYSSVGKPSEKKNLFLFVFTMAQTLVGPWSCGHH